MASHSLEDYFFEVMMNAVVGHGVISENEADEEERRYTHEPGMNNSIYLVGGQGAMGLFACVGLLWM